MRSAHPSCQRVAALKVGSRTGHFRQRYVVRRPHRLLFCQASSSEPADAEPQPSPAEEGNRDAQVEAGYGSEIDESDWYRAQFEAETLLALQQQGIQNQQEWDRVREFALTQYLKGKLPYYINKKWLFQKEAPNNNQILADMGFVPFHYSRLPDAANLLDQDQNNSPEDPAALETGGGDDGGKDQDQNISPEDPAALETGGGDEGGKDGGDDGRGGDAGGNQWGDGYEEEEYNWFDNFDIYWPLRDHGCHPMMLWTISFAALLAVSGLATSIITKRWESLQWGLSCGALLASSGWLMEDMRNGFIGVAGVKIAFAVCALLALKDCYQGWQHRASNHRRLGPHMGATGWSATLMCAGYIMTGMNGLDEIALPLTPGAVFKSGDIALKQRVWQKWGFGRAYMR